MTVPLTDTDPALLTLLTDAGDKWGPLGVALAAAQLSDPRVVVTRLATEPHLGLATTDDLLTELRTRIEMDYYVGGGGLGYTTVHGRPGGDHDVLLPDSGDEVTDAQ